MELGHEDGEPPNACALIRSTDRPGARTGKCPRRRGNRLSLRRSASAPEPAPRARDCIASLTDRQRLQLPVEHVVSEVNAFLRGFADCFRYGTSVLQIVHINSYAAERLALFVGERHKRGPVGVVRLVASPD